MKKTRLILLLSTAGLVVPGAALSSELPGEWNLAVENPEHRVVTTLTVEFTDEQAESCLGGDWKTVKVISSTTGDEAFFPRSEPLAYQIEQDQLTIGRNQMCDAYLLLKGKLGEPQVKGDYFSFGMGGSFPLGYFELSRGR
ncbi:MULTISPECIES: hypothetical protein [unclassified Luteibacter]|uniref:hypothetical protein n=1 Tax=Luteibacter sp. PvP019 TaxID=3156436 RepID=UPI003394E6FD